MDMPGDGTGNVSDESLALSSRADPRAYVELVRRYEARLLAYVRRISGVGKEDAEDILQESLLDAYRHISEFDPSLKFSSWIYRIVHNRTISEYRKRKRTFGDISVDEDPSLAERLFPVESGAVAETEAALSAEAIRKVLAMLPERDREVLVLAYLEGKKYEEIGDILRVPMGTVATWVRRAKMRFRDKALEAGIRL